MLKNYLKIALRNLLKYKTYSFINIIGLAIGIAACLMITLYVLDDLSYDNYHQDVNRIFRIVVDVQSETGELQYATTPSSLALALKQDFPQVERAIRFMTNPELMIQSGAEKKFYENRVFHTDPEIFQVFNLPFIYGDPNSCLNRPRTVVITEEISKKYFGDINPIGKSLDFGYAQFEVTGVVKNVPSNSHLKFDFLISLRPFDPKSWQKEGWRNIDGQQGLTYTYIKLTKSCDVTAFKNQIKNISERYAGGMQLKESGETQRYSLQPIKDIHLHSNRRNEVEAPGNAMNIAIFSVIAWLVLIIACLNFVNLTTARSTTRAKEVGLRQVLGAFRWQLIKQFLGESLLLSLIALVVALVLVEMTLPWFNALSNKMLKLDIFSNIILLFILFAIVLFVGFMAGSYPALFLASFRPARIFRGNLMEGISGTSLRKVLVICQFTASVILIVGTLIIYQQLRFMKNSNLGFDKERLLILPVPVGALFDKNSEEFISSEFKKHHAILSATTTSYIPGMNKNLFKGSLKL
ncbi:MAG TPA: ABC transporter permease, partial [bacterium]